MIELGNTMDHRTAHIWETILESTVLKSTILKLNLSCSIKVDTFLALAVLKSTEDSLA